MVAWAYEKGRGLHCLQPGKPTQNVSIESFNGKLRDEFHNEHVVVSFKDAQRKIETWREDYNAHGPYRSLNKITPNEFAASISDEITHLKKAYLAG